ncbi:kinase-like protein [Xylaria sp. FL1777]|nr:kinase-like protein [Xylaria sp. FL1777]
MRATNRVDIRISTVMRVCTAPVTRCLESNNIKGVIIHDLRNRRVVRNGDKVTKIVALYGVKEAEAEVMRFVREHTTIPVPRVYATTPKTITMDYIEGISLDKAWNDLSDVDRIEITNQLRGYLDQLRAIKGSYIGGFGRRPAIDERRFSDEGGPFESEAEWNDFMLEGSPFPEMLVSVARGQLRNDHEIVLTHGDLHPCNIIVRDGRIAAIIDWELAGFYPEYHAMVKPLRNAQWYIGYYPALPDIFLRRYDAEYVVDQFISRIAPR